MPELYKPKSSKSQKGLTDDELIAAIEAEEKSAYGFYNGELAEERQTALDYYHGEPFPEDEAIPEGRSRVVSSDVADTIEWVLPSLLKIFMSGDDVCKFEPVGPEDVEQAEQETAYVNWLVLQKNAAFETFYSWFKDALTQKLGYVKAYYDESEDTEQETYYGKTDDEFAMLASDPDIKLVAHTERAESVQVMQPQPDGSIAPSVVTETRHDVTVERVDTRRGLVIEPVPPEELYVSTAHRRVSLQGARFVEHKTRKTISEIRAMGYEVSDDISDTTNDETEERNRDRYEEWRLGNPNGDPSSREIWLRDIYIQIDRNGDGIAEKVRVMMVGRTILHEELYEVVPFAALCPIPAPHRHVGQSYADILMDLQEIKSMLWRLTLDNGYLSLNGRHAISDRVNLDDMLVSRPGGVVRVEGGDIGGAIMPLQHVPTGNNGLQLLEYTDSVKENRSGVTKYNQGLDANSLNKTATGITAIMGAAQERMGLVARIFAETGVKDLFLLVHHCARKYSDKEDVFRLRNKYIPVNPRSWVKRTDMTVSVGLGTGSREAQLGHLGTMYQMAMPAIQAGVLPPTTLVELLRKMAVNAGFKDVDSLFPDPQENQQPQGPDPAMMQAQQQAQAEQQKVAAEQQKSAAEFQLKQAQMQIGVQESQNKAQIEQAKIQANAQIEAQKLQVQAMLAEQQIALEREKMEHEKAIETARMQLEIIKTQSVAPAQEPHDNNVIIQGIQAIIETLNRPKTVVRGPDGLVVGIS